MDFLSRRRHYQPELPSFLWHGSSTDCHNWVSIRPNIQLRSLILNPMPTPKCGRRRAHYSALAVEKPQISDHCRGQTYAWGLRYRIRITVGGRALSTVSD
jgi:hypothetical protein